MKEKKHFTIMVIAAILFTFIGAGYVFAADSDKKALSKETGDKSMEMQNKKDRLKTDKAEDSDKKGLVEKKTIKSKEMQTEKNSMKTGTQSSMNYGDKSAKKSSMASELIGMTVKSNQNEDLGQVQDLIINESGRIQYMVISQGGILGVGADRIPIPFNDAMVDSDNKVVTLDKIDKQMLTNAPEFTEDDWKTVGDPQFDQKMRGYYGEDTGNDFDQTNRMKPGDDMNQENRMKQENYDNKNLKE